MLSSDACVSPEANAKQRVEEPLRATNAACDGASWEEATTLSPAGDGVDKIMVTLHEQ